MSIAFYKKLSDYYLQADNEAVNRKIRRRGTQLSAVYPRRSGIILRARDGHLRIRAHSSVKSFCSSALIWPKRFLPPRLFAHGLLFRLCTSA